MESLRFFLHQFEIPTHGYNVVADMPNPPCRDSGEAKTILVNLTGHGHLDMASYNRNFG